MKSSTQPKSVFKKSSSVPNLPQTNNFKTRKGFLEKTVAEGQQKKESYKNQTIPNTPERNTLKNNISSERGISSTPKTTKNSSRTKMPKIILEFKNEEEKIKFTELKEKYPHICMPITIKKIQQSQNIDGFDVLLTDEWIELQKEGWEFLKIMKPDQLEDPPESDEYRLEPLNNRWGDFVLFKKAF